MAETKKSMKGYYGLTFLIGLGFFTMGLMDPLYDNYVPILLSRYIGSKGIIGTIMTLDNIFAIFLIPIVSAISDRTRTKIGRRMPYIIVTLPLTAVFFSLIPFAALKSLAFLVIAVFFLNVFKQSARGPVVALMPDTIPGDVRSEANGVINTMGGIAAIVGTIGLARLWDVSVVLPIIGDTAKKLPFLISGVLVIAATILLFFFVKEKQRSEEEKREPILTSLRLVLGSKDKSASYILLSLLLWFLAYQGLLPFMGLYTKDIIGTSGGTAALSSGMFAVAYAIFAIPSGLLAHRYGRKRVIRIALVVMTAISLAIFLHALLTRPPLLASPKVEAGIFERDILAAIPPKNSDDKDFLLKVYAKEGNFYVLDPSLKDDDRIKAFNIIKFTPYIPESIPAEVMDKRILPRLSVEKRNIMLDNYSLKDGAYEYLYASGGNEGMRESLKEVLNASIASSALTLYSYWGLLFLFGMFWVTVITNSFPMLWQMADYGNMGIYTGLYYTFSQAASILAPPITGFIIDLTSFRGIYIYSALCMFGAFLTMGLVKKGEVGQPPA